MINSDAHHPQEVSKQFAETAQMLLAIGYKEVRILAEGKWHNRTLTPKGIQF
jgi:histidinol-phosphatase (PHP family)